MLSVIHWLLGLWRIRMKRQKSVLNWAIFWHMIIPTCAQSNWWSAALLSKAACPSICRPMPPAAHFLLSKWENSRSSLCTLCRSQAEETSAVLSPGAGHTASKHVHIWLQEVVAYKQSDIFPVHESMQISYNSTVSMLSYGRGLDRLTQANFAEWLRYLPFQNNVPLS